MLWYSFYYFTLKFSDIVIS